MYCQMQVTLNQSQTLTVKSQHVILTYLTKKHLERLGKFTKLLVKRIYAIKIYALYAMSPSQETTHSTDTFQGNIKTNQSYYLVRRKEILSAWNVGGNVENC